MKRIRIIVLLLIILVFAIIAASLSNELISKENIYARKLQFKEEQLLAIFYIGGSSNNYSFNLVNKYYTENEIKKFDNIDIGGEECYLIIPRYKNVLKISSLSMNEEGGTNIGLVKEVTGPFFLKCNVSDIFSNSNISFEYNGEEYNYSPYISLKDGSVVTEEFVLLVEK